VNLLNVAFSNDTLGAWAGIALIALGIIWIIVVAVGMAVRWLYHHHPGREGIAAADDLSAIVTTLLDWIANNTPAAMLPGFALIFLGVYVLVKALAGGSGGGGGGSSGASSAAVVLVGVLRSCRCCRIEPLGRPSRGTSPTHSAQ
jgi:hypothetical protein